jgi:dipeptidyl aminopeptidase/acylaminoacyl peptidase
MTEHDWRRRFTAPRIEAVTWAPGAPERLAIVSNESGSAQAWAWDLATGARRQVSGAGVGAEEAHILPDGSGVVWWLDQLGDERGRWMCTPFGGGDPAPLMPEAGIAWMSGLSFTGDVVAAGYATDDGYEIRVGRPGRPSRVIYRSDRPAGVGAEWPQGRGGLSADGMLVAIHHAEKGDISHPAVRVLDAATGEVRGEVFDEGRQVAAAGWSPIPGDRRLVVIRETGEFERPWLWSLDDDVLTQVGTELEGAVALMDWFPDGDALLLRQDHEARHSLHRGGIGGGVGELVPQGHTILDAAVRPDGDVWYVAASSVEPTSVRALGGAEPISLPDPAPQGRAYREIAFENGHGQTIHGFVVTPPGEGPFPTVLSIHGGPEHHHTDDFSPKVQAFVDGGFAVVLVNYRGSTGYGRAHREAIHGDIGFPESEDVIAALDHVVAEGIADPARVCFSGWSWGGYLATLNAGINPDRWRAVFAGIPVGDYVAAHYECAPLLRNWDLATLGGSPIDLPELYAERNPMSYIDRVRAPMLVIAGEHDSRCPIGQVMTYVVWLRAHGRDVDLHLYPQGHHANNAAEQVRHMELILDFFGRHTT